MKENVLWKATVKGAEIEKKKRGPRSRRRLPLEKVALAAPSTKKELEHAKEFELFYHSLTGR